MIWLQSPPWARWMVAGAIGLLALWIELAPKPTVDHPFAVVDIARGEVIGPVNTRMRPVPAGLMTPVSQGAIAARGIPAGSPILEADSSPETALVPAGLWAVKVEVPEGSQVGDRVLLLVPDTGLVVEGVVSSLAGSDPFSIGSGAVAVGPDHAGAVGAAAADGRLVVLVSTG